MKPELKLDWCSYEAAKYAVEHWHYSKRMPDPKCVKVGVWENGAFIGAVIFSRGVSSTNLSKTLGIKSIEIAELSRVALKAHKSPTSRIISIACRLLKLKDSGLKVLISYADENQGHVGVVYQAANWIYTGQSAAVALFQDKRGRFIHDRACSNSGFKRQFGSLKRVPKRESLQRIPQRPKWRYMLPLDASIRPKVVALGKPYPKRATSETIDTAVIQIAEGGEAPTVALQNHG